MSKYEIKAGDTLRPLNLTLLEADGTASDLTGLVSVTLRVLFSDGETEDFTMSVVDADEGTVTYEWQAGETDTVGTHDAEVIGETMGGDRITWPARGRIPLVFYAAIPEP